ncbi:MAG: tRNA (guanosine(37)-N1)-methyltransferase TrmD [Candidatus Peribacter sp.]|jgi:tRNA (guanine37-N1)-methyltransferase|nr:tRNA (guanosine(37)-N1)-methyltransferase TrmD [Candidatus Peribacter sp.]MBT4393285.1 tRNA (guanosine(37)-N1)-methyltransferase TrmD [Candidatus Peribacter sp.]MBT4601180.1 tRNA (guanosine(37)-N1)-methyltransferase TrmD [Candidatus Peribacter sp.]MBT5148860.1 tRNA (guanosine(37)-N1)-methyltransferase TrmD [Candidatus Peribacter sp.]MBT5637260.1 tRNA (guanosine(37)-N1)-methyltransferase TrmD [Candidatus Peribacter sp.]
MRIDILTLHPAMFQGPLTESILGRAQEASKLEVHTHDLKEFGLGNYRQVDDEPYGGGAGMVIRVDVVVPAIEAVTKSGKLKVESGKSPHRIYLSARGETLRQEKVESLSAEHDWLILLCGHYEGIDQRIVEGGWIDEEISIGDYVLTGGELPAMVLIDSVARHIPGVLGKEASAHEESFSEELDRKKEYPHYTRPDEYEGLKVPDVLLSGHHAEIEKWRRSQLS